MPNQQLGPTDLQAMMPETYANPLAQSWLASLGRAFMAPGQAYQSTTPITTEQMIKPATDIAMMTTLGAGAAPAEANALRAGMSSSKGFQALEDARFKAEQDYIKANLPPPTSSLPTVDYVKHYTKNMAPEDVLQSDALWAKARDLHAVRNQQGRQVPFSKSFSDLSHAVLGRPLTPNELTTAMIGAAQAGIP